MQAGQYLTNTRGSSSPEARICNERLESLCNALDRPMLLYIALKGHWRYSLVTDKVSATMQIAQRIRSLAQEHDDSALMLGGYIALAVPLYFSGDFEGARAIRETRSGDLAHGTSAVSGRRGYPVRSRLPIL